MMQTSPSRPGFLLILLSFGVFLAYLVPEWLAFIKSDVYVYVNGWDEETYLSWQGLLGSRNSPGYFALYFNWLLQRVGISGAYQNILFDSLLPPMTVYFAYLSFRLLQTPVPRALAYAVLVFFSSTLFNYANPLVKHILGPYDATGIFMAGWELYPSILRTPNPQISYFLISMAVYGFLRYKKFWMLLLPFPLLYFHVAVPCFFLLTVTVVYHKLMSKYAVAAYVAILAAFLASMLILGLGFMGMAHVMGLYDPGHPYRANSLLFAETREVQIPLALAVMAGGYAVIKKFQGFREDATLPLGLVLLAVTAVGAVNLHMFTGFMLSQKNYYDYGLSLVFGLSLVLMVEMLHSEKVRGWLLHGLLGAVLLITGVTQLPWYRDSVVVSRQMRNIIEQVRKDPLHAVIPDLRLSSRVAYSTAMLPAPPFSYQYYFGFIVNQCEVYQETLDGALRFAKQQHLIQGGDVSGLEEIYRNIKNNKDKNENKAQYEYCALRYANNESFYMVRN